MTLLPHEEREGWNTPTLEAYLERARSHMVDPSDDACAWEVTATALWLDLIEARHMLGRSRNWVREPDLRAAITNLVPPPPRTEE
jgi:hypothetical protein